MGNRHIIFMSHGNMAQETLKSAEMIVGETSNTHVISMAAEDGLSGTNYKLSSCLETIGKEQNVLVLADLKGGTPCNVAMMKMKKYPNLKVMSGLNLALAIEAIMSPVEDIESFLSSLVATGKDAVNLIEIPDLEDDEEYED